MQTVPVPKRAWQDHEGNAHCYLTWTDAQGGYHGETVRISAHVMTLYGHGLRQLFINALAQELRRVGAMR